jgi:purine-binding chemotaxis protein CheW
MRPVGKGWAMSKIPAKSYDIAHTLQEMRDEYWRGIEEGANTSEEQSEDYLLFHLANERFAVPTCLAREVLRVPKLVKVPRLGAHILGIINLRGQIVAVTDLRPLLGLSGRELSTGGQLVVIEAAGISTALLVDRVEGISSFPLAGIEPLTEGLSGFPREAVSGQVHQEQGLILLLDMRNILGRQEFLIDQKRTESQ